MSIYSKIKNLLRTGWCKGAYAMDSQNKAVSPLNKFANQYCLAGAIMKVTNQDFALANHLARRFCLSAGLGVMDLSLLEKWHDVPERTLEEIIHLIDKTEMEDNNLYVH